MKDVQRYELFGGIALKNHAFSFHFHLNHENFSLLFYFLLSLIRQPNKEMFPKHCFLNRQNVNPGFYQTVVFLKINLFVVC